MREFELRVLTQDNTEWIVLDTYDESLDITYQIYDINNISNRKASFSKTITIPLTPINKNFLDNISNINVTTSSFNPNQKTKCSILSRDIPIFTGFLQLKRIIINLDSDDEAEIVIIGDNQTLFTQIGDKYLTDLDLSELDHVYNKDNVVYSWTQSQSFGYYYPLIDQSQNLTSTNVANMGITGFAPAVYIKTLIDKIFDDADCRYESTFIDTDYFKNLIMPINVDNVGVGKNFKDNYSFRAGTLTGYDYTPSWVYGTPGNPATLYPSYGGTVVGTPVADLKFVDDSTLPNYDKGNSWDTSIFEYTYNGPNYQKMRFNVQLQMAVDNVLINGNLFDEQHAFYLGIRRSCDPVLLTCYPMTHSYTANIEPFHIFGDPILIASSSNTSPYGATSTVFVAGNDYMGTGQNRYTYNINLVTPWTDNNSVTNPGIGLKNGEKLIFYIQWRFRVRPTATVGPGATYSYYWITPNSYIESEFATGIQEYKYMEMSSFLPPKIKQKDFLTSLFNMFNLYIEYNSNTNTYKIEPKDIYYSQGNVLDWSAKIDSSQPISVDILSDKQPKQFNFKYKEGKDFYNNDYQTINNRTYGDYFKMNTNEFTTQDKTISLIFNPAPLVQVPNTNFVIPIIKKTSNSDTTVNIMLKRMLLNPVNNQFGFNGTKYTYNGYPVYPYAGHLDDPYNPKYDLNYDAPLGFYFNNNNPTNNNLIKMFWESTITDLTSTNQRLVTCQAFLTPSDVMRFSFKDRINIFLKYGTQMFVVNKIIGYDPTQNGLSTLELIPYTPSKKYTFDYTAYNPIGPIVKTTIGG